MFINIIIQRLEKNEMKSNMNEKEYEEIKKDEELKDRELFGEKELEQEHKDLEIEKELDPMKRL